MGRLIAFVLALCAGLIFASAAVAQETRPLLHPMFGDHAVLQRGQSIAVWGWAEPGARVFVALEGDQRSTRAGRDGRWRLDLPARPAGGPYTLSARVGDRVERAEDVLVGDVYLCSGQSNMEFQTRYATNAYTVLNEAGSGDAEMRLFQVQRVVAGAPREIPSDGDQWRIADRDAVADFSAVCYFFGRDLRQTQHVPIGLIHPSWGGTVIEAWMSAEGLSALGPRFATPLALMQQYQTDPAGAQARFAQLMEQWWATNDPGGRAHWEATDFDDASWPTIAPTGFWENAGVRELASFDGIAWYRTEFFLNAAQAEQGGRFELGPADDIDATYLNGRALGAVSGWDTPRTYDVAPGALRAGRNVLAAAVLDTGGGGGFWGPTAEKVLVLADGSRISLTERPWRYRISAPLSEVTSPPQAPWGGPNGYSALYNGMVAPIAPYGLRGVLWYQGEANANAYADYQHLLPGWMADWRGRFENPNLPFLIVQLANYGPVAPAPVRDSWGRIRDVQRRVVEADAHAGLAVSVDIGDRFDIHPTQKLIVAERLARLARHRIYGEDIVDSGPSPLRAVRGMPRVVIDFANTPLVTYSHHRPMGFELCTVERRCEFVDADLVGNDAVALTPRTISLAEVSFVRFCWGDAPICNLYNEDDLPAVPFELAIVD